MARSGNFYTSSANLTAWYNFSRRELVYGDVMYPAAIKHT
jgi:hypothetical protein